MSKQHTIGFLKALIVFLIFCFSTKLKSQVYGFQKINQENGLPSSVINCVTQDSRNLIWIGTDGAGLVRYDGNSFKTYDETNGLKGTFVTDVLEDENSNLIVASKYYGIVAFDGVNFFRDYNTNDKNIVSNAFYKLVKGEKGIYCVGEEEIILIKKDYSFEKIYEFKIKIGATNSIAIDSLNNLFIATSKGLYVLNLKNTEFKSVNPKIFGGYVTLAQNKENNILVSSNDGVIYSIAGLSGGVNEIMPRAFFKLPNHFRAKKMFLTRRGSLWVAGENKQGLLMVSGGYTTSFDQENGFSGENVNCFMQDKSHNLFIGTSGSGLIKTGPQSFVDYYNISYLNSSVIYSIYKDEKYLYTGVRGEGVCRYTVSPDGEILFDKIFKNEAGANVIFKNHKGEILVGSYNGISKINDEKFISVNTSDFSKNKLNVVSLQQDSTNRYFIGTYGSGLYITDERFKPIACFNTENKLFVDFVYTIDQFESNKWYIGTNNGMYILTEKSKNEFIISKQLVENIVSISTKDIYGNYWFVGSNFIYTYSKNGIKKFDRKNGLTSILIYTLIADKKGNLWLGSNLGLDKIQVNEKAEIVSIKNYNFKNGFKGLETNTRAQFVDSFGDIYLGTAKGMVQCLSNYHSKVETTPSIIITNVKISNQDKNWSLEGVKNNWVNVPDSGYEFKISENQLAFEFNVVNMEYSDNYYFSYKLEGSDKEWSNPTTLREVSYSHLRSGRYTFRVRLVDVRGISLNSETHYSFSIETPFYLTWWFVTIILFSFFFIIYYLFKKFSTFNTDFVTDNSETTRANKQEARLFILIFGFFAPFSETLVTIFGVRNHNELIPSLIISVLCITSYHFSKKSKAILDLLPLALKVVFYMYFSSSVLKIYFLPFEVINFADYCLIVFFSIAIFKAQRQYWFFVFLAVVFSISLFLVPHLTIHTAVIFLNATLFIIAMNYARYVSNLNQNEKLIFSNTIVNNGSSLTIASNNMGEIVFCSNNVQKILGYTPEEVFGFGFWKLTEDTEFKNTDYSQKFIEGKVYVRKLKCKNGSYKHIQWTNTKHSDNLFIGIGQDVTEQINVQERYQNMVQNATDLIFEADGDGNFIFVNDVITKVLGFTPDELVGKHFTSLIREDWKLKVSKFYVKNLPKGNQFDILEFPVISKANNEIWVSQKVNAKRNEHGKIIGYAAIVRDVTAIKKIEFINLARQEKINKYNLLLSELNKNPNNLTSSFKTILENILFKACQAMDIQRISIWETFEDRIECSKVLDFRTGIFNKGEIIYKNEFPIYFNAITNGITIRASNVCENENTKEFCDLDAYVVKSLLDLPIFFNGKLNGLICCEMISDYRNWDDEDLNFVRSIAEIISISIETRKRQKAEKKLAFRNEISAAIAKITDKLLVSDNLPLTLNESFHFLGTAMRVDKAHYYENDIKTNVLNLKSEWSKEGTIAVQKNEHRKEMPVSSLGPIATSLLANRAFACITSELEDSNLKAAFEQRKILSNLIVPIFIKDVFYGFISFDDCQIERVWDESHIIIIKTLATNIANTIDRINSESIIKESEANFRQINENLNDVFLLYDLIERRYIYISPNCETILGMTQTEFLNGENFIDTMVYDEHKHLFALGESDLQSKGSYEIEYQIKTKSNEEKWVREKGNAIFDSEGKLIRQSSICSDISAYKKSETQLKQLSFVAQNTKNIIIIANPNGEIEWVNDAFTKSSGYTIDEVKGKKPGLVLQGELTNKNTSKRISESLKLQKSVRAEILNYSKRGKQYWVDISIDPVFDNKGQLLNFIGVQQDITEKKKTEAELKQLSIVAEKTINGVLITDKEGRSIWANQGYLNMFDIPSNKIIGNRPRDVFEIISKSQIELMDKLGEESFKLELELYTFLKRKIWIEIVNTKIFNHEGNVVQQIEVITDITETVKQKKALERYSNDLEFQSVLQKKIIKALTYEELAIETLGFIQNHIDNCMRIALFNLDAKNSTLSGHVLVNGVLEEFRMPAKDTLSFDTLLKGEAYIQKDIRLSENKSKSDMDWVKQGMISYIVLPILENKKLLGTLNLSFDKEFTLTDSELKNLESFTILLSVALQQIALKHELVEKNKGNMESLNYAQNIQKAVLPQITNLPQVFKDVCLYFKPRDIVSGDFYWIKQVGDLTYFALADCTGHGVPGAFLTLIGGRLLEKIIDKQRSNDPASILNELDEELYFALNNKGANRLNDGMEIALCIIDNKASKLYFAGAGIGLCSFTDDQTNYINGQRKSIGDYRQSGFKLQTSEITYDGSEIFYLSTDGYPDQLGGQNYKRYSKQRLLELMKKIKRESSNKKVEIFENEMKEYIGGYRQTDDITIISFSLRSNILN